jgi:hypothetical protein
MPGAWRTAGGLAAPLLAAVLLGALALAGMAAPARAAVTVLYDGDVAGETLADQGFYFITQPSPPAEATAFYADGGTTLETQGNIEDYAGYTIRETAAVPLDRALGFTLHFTAQVLSEDHTSDDRAGLSVLLLAADSVGIELGFWEGEVWAQNDGPQIFTHGEGAAINFAAPVVFALRVQGERYSLSADGEPLLEGPLRDYRGHPSYPPQQYPAYYLPNYLFLGDNTSRASVAARLLAVALEHGAAPASTSTATRTSTPSSTATATQTPTSTTIPGTNDPPTATATPSATATATATPTVQSGPADGPKLIYLPLVTR